MVTGRAGDAGPVSSPWVDDDGTVLFATPSARRWLESTPPRPGLPGPGGLATSVALRVVAQERSGDPGPVILRLHRGGEWLTVHGERVRRPGGEPHGVALVVQPAHPGELLPLAVAAFRLSARELAVVRTVFCGADSRGAARALRVTPNTVQDHLKSVFRKVGVNSRGELAVALSQLASWPRIDVAHRPSVGGWPGGRYLWGVRGGAASAAA